VEIVDHVRWYQEPLFTAWTKLTHNRLIEIAHRRWGKDEIALKATRQHALQRPAGYWHCLPEYEQGRRAIWNAVNPHTGKRRIEEAFPRPVVARRDETQMFIELINGSTWQIVGSDRYDRTVGASPAGIVYSEWALANPSAWGYHRPMVEENNGWAAFITTPRGNNHAKSMLDMARQNPRWFAEVSTAHDTGALTQEQLDEALIEYQAIYGADFGRAMFEQEYLCSFAGAMVGAYFGAEMNRAERDGRITQVDVDPAHPVHTAWDLGKAVNNPIWCFQVIAGQPRIVDFYLPDSENLEDWCAWLDARGYNGTDYVPHDVMTTEWGNSRTRIETLRQHGRKPQRLPRVSVADGLQAARLTINEAVFDAERCALGVEGLKNYRRDWDDERKTFRETPVKDWAEHIGSAFRYLGLAWRDVKPPEAKPAPLAEPEYTLTPSGKVIGKVDVQAWAMERARKKKDR